MKKQNFEPKKTIIRKPINQQLVNNKNKNMKTKTFAILICLFISLSIYSQGAHAFTRVYDRLDYLDNETNEWIIAGTNMTIDITFNYLHYFDRISIYFNGTRTIIYPNEISTEKDSFSRYTGADNSGDNIYIMHSDSLGILILQIEEDNTTMRFIESSKRVLKYPNELKNK